MPLTVYNTCIFPPEVQSRSQVTLVSDEGEPYDGFLQLMSRIREHRIALLSISYTNVDALVFLYDTRSEWYTLI